MAVKIVTLLLEMSTSYYCVWFFGIFSALAQSNVKRSLCFSYVLFITWNAFHQVNNVLTFTVNFVIDFKFPFVYLLVNAVVDVNWLQHRLPVFDKHGEQLSMVNVFFTRLPFPFWMHLLPISSFRFLFLLKAVIGSS